MAGAEILLGALFAWIQYLRGPSLRLGHGFPDFVIYSALGHQLRQHGFGGIYDLGLQQEFQRQVTGSSTQVLPYISPPYLTPLWWPFGGLDLKTGYIVWASITALLAAASILVLLRGSGLRQRSAWAAGVVAAAWVPALVTVLQGQTTSVVLIALAGAAVLWTTRREGAAGAASVLAFVRPHMALAIPVLYLLRSPRRAFAGLAAGLALLCLVTLPLVGVDNWRGYLQLVLPWLVHGQNLSSVAFEQARYSLRGLLDAAGAPTPLTAAVLAAAAVAVLLVLLRRGARAELDFALATSASVVLSPHQNLHDLLLLLVPLLLVGVQLARGGLRYPALGWAAVGVCYLSGDVALFIPLAAAVGALVLLAYLMAERLVTIT